jgi:hypothetical protein
MLEPAIATGEWIAPRGVSVVGFSERPGDQLVRTFGPEPLRRHGSVGCVSRAPSGVGCAPLRRCESPLDRRNEPGTPRIASRERRARGLRLFGRRGFPPHAGKPAIAVASSLRGGCCATGPPRPGGTSPCSSERKLDPSAPGAVEQLPFLRGRGAVSGVPPGPGEARRSSDRRTDLGANGFGRSPTIFGSTDGPRSHRVREKPDGLRIDGRTSEPPGSGEARRSSDRRTDLGATGSERSPTVFGSTDGPRSHRVREKPDDFRIDGRTSEPPGPGEARRSSDRRTDLGATGSGRSPTVFGPTDGPRIHRVWREQVRPSFGMTRLVFGFDAARRSSAIARDRRPLGVEGRCGVHPSGRAPRQRTTGPAVAASSFGVVLWPTVQRSRHGHRALRSPAFRGRAAGLAAFLTLFGARWIASVPPGPPVPSDPSGWEIGPRVHPVPRSSPRSSGQGDSRGVDRSGGGEGVAALSGAVASALARCKVSTTRKQRLVPFGVYETTCCLRATCGVATRTPVLEALRSRWLDVHRRAAMRRGSDLRFGGSSEPKSRVSTGRDAAPTTRA